VLFVLSDMYHVFNNVTAFLVFTKSDNISFVLQIFDISYEIKITFVL